ncbi:MAG: diguanylate cyclase [Solirubrobacteraceae bacterium]
MSFRRRLSQFFIVIVVVPMVAVSLVLFRLISDNETGKADAALAAGSRAAAGLYKAAGTGARARGAVGVVAADRQLASTLSSRDLKRAQARADVLVRVGVAARIRVAAGGRTLVDAGSADALAPIVRRLVAAGTHRPLGVLEVSVQNAPGYLREVQKITGLRAVLAGPGLPAAGNVADTRSGGHDYRATTLAAQGFGNARVLISLLGPRASTGSSLRHGQELEAAVLAAFFALALAFALLISRSLQQQLAEFLAAARRLGSGDFSRPVPVHGSDEFAALGTEFNSMSEQLEERLEDLRREQARLEGALQRIGETFASNLDRDGLLEIVLRTAVDGVRASAGRAVVPTERGEHQHERARVGPADEFLESLSAAEKASLGSSAPANADAGGGFALAHPLAGAAGSFGTVSVARRDGAFTDRERELFHYLARQAGVSMENVGLHELVQQQAVTDELTGLYNHRRFQEDLESEVERARRFENAVGLVLLDIDDFKLVNDTYGHQQGDAVLRAVARVLREFSREIDSPARYGGEELALVLPQTDLNGAFQLAERLRAGIESLRVDLVDVDGSASGANGAAMSVTASLGVAALPDCGASPAALIGAADTALYEAKRTGKNKTVRAR